MGLENLEDWSRSRVSLKMEMGILKTVILKLEIDTKVKAGV